MEQLPLLMIPKADPSFASFMPGSNEAALDHLRGLPAGAAPVYLWGPTGCGKTHLLRALANARQQQGTAVGWFDADAVLPWELEPSVGLLVLDRCDLLDAARQHAAFALFVDATTKGAQIAGAGRVPPVDLPLRDDLRTRLAWGHVFALEPLDEPQSRRVLQAEALRRGIELDEDVVDHVMNRFERDLGSLMGLLDRLDYFASVNRRRINLPLVRRMLADVCTA